MESPSSYNANSLAIESHHLRDFKLALEFQSLASTAPGGVYMFPEFDNIRVLHGVIFVRRGLYRDGVFRFIMELDREYNGLNRHPRIRFTPPVLHPLIDPETGVYDLRLDEALREWQPDRHYLGTALASLKRIFYLTAFDANVWPIVPNEAVRALFLADPDQFAELAQREARQSQVTAFDPPATVGAGCTLLFTEPRPAHSRVRETIFKVAPGGSIADTVEDKDVSDPLDRDPDAYDVAASSPGRRYSLSKHLPAGGEGPSVTLPSEHCLQQLEAEVRRPFVYDVTNEAEDTDDRTNNK